MGAVDELRAAMRARHTRDSGVLNAITVDPGRLAVFEELWAMAMEEFRDPARWFLEPSERYGGVSAVEALSTEEGAEAVRRVLHAIRSGGVA